MRLPPFVRHPQSENAVLHTVVLEKHSKPGGKGRQTGMDDVVLSAVSKASGSPAQYKSGKQFMSPSGHVSPSRRVPYATTHLPMGLHTPDSHASENEHCAPTPRVPKGTHEAPEMLQARPLAQSEIERQG